VTPAETQLLTEGFAVLPRQCSRARIASIAAAHDEAVAAASPSDVGGGRTTVRVWDFVNRGPAFDELYLLDPVLAACRLVIGTEFKLSTMHSRAVRPHAPVDTLHVDFAREALDVARGAWPMLGFIVMLDDFTPQNGATRFVPGSQLAAERPSGIEPVPACGPAGSVIVYNGSVWHGHGANVTDRPRRSIQGAYIRRDAVGFDLAPRMRPETLARIGPRARELLAV
jgi:ectoine hydroxylase-related dioxygenase (phytanoyl-CoA dioxygenase family)